MMLMQVHLFQTVHFVENMFHIFQKCICHFTLILQDWLQAGNNHSMLAALLFQHCDDSLYQLILIGSVLTQTFIFDSWSHWSHFLRYFTNTKNQKALSNANIYSSFSLESRRFRNDSTRIFVVADGHKMHTDRQQHFEKGPTGTKRAMMCLTHTVTHEKHMQDKRKTAHRSHISQEKRWRNKKVHKTKMVLWPLFLVIFLHNFTTVYILRDKKMHIYTYTHRRLFFFRLYVSWDFRPL